MNMTKDAVIGLILGLLFIIVIVVIVKKPEILEPQEPDRQMPQVDAHHQSGYDELRLIDLQIEAVIIDMDRYLGWFPDEKDMIKKASVKARSNLKTVRQYLNNVHFSDELSQFKEFYLKISNRLSETYKGIESKDPNTIEGLFNEVDSLYSECYAKLAESINASDYVYRLPEEYDFLQEQIKYCDSREDSKTYLNAVNMIKDRDFNKAFTLLTPLQKKYHHTVFGSCVNYWVSECLIYAEIEGQEETIFDLEKGITLLSEIIECSQYSPVLFDAFDLWRSQYQMFCGGMSNRSNIQNWDYNLLRWKAIKTARTYLKTNPENPWAKSQLSKLLGEPNMGRGGPYGNDNIIYWSELYGNE